MNTAAISMLLTYAKILRDKPKPYPAVKRSSYIIQVSEGVYHAPWGGDSLTDDKENAVRFDEMSGPYWLKEYQRRDPIKYAGAVLIPE